MEVVLEALKDRAYVIKVELPSYVKTFGVEKSGDLFICDSEVKSSSCSTQCNSSGSELDITGSPLKDSFSVADVNTSLAASKNWQDEEADYLPLTQEEARLLLRKYAKNYRKNGQDCPQVWVLSKGATVLHASELLQGWWSRTLVTQHKPKHFDDIDTSVLVAQHTSIARMPDVTPKCQVVATCAVSTNTNSIHVNKEKTNVTVEFRWNQPVKKPPHDTTAVINITCDAGNNANRLWQQLILLYDWMESLRSIRFSGGHEVKLPGSGNFMEKLNDIEFLNTHLRGSPPTTISEAFTDDSTVPCDSTDKLWLIFADCNDQNELKRCLHIFFGHILSQEVNAYVRPTNCTTAARIIKELISGKRSTVPELLGSECVEIIIETGLEKLINEYCHIFLSTNLLTSSKMKHGLNFSGRVSDVDNCMMWLAKRHAALELVAAAEKWMLLDWDCLSTLALDAVVFCDSTVCSLEAFLTNPTIRMHTTVDTKLVLHTLKSEFLQFRLNLTSENERLKVKSVFLFTKLPIFPENICYDYDNSADDCDSYIYSELLHISDKIF